MVGDGFTHVAFGDLFLEDVRRYRENHLAGTGLTPLFPSVAASRRASSRDEMIAGGLRARLSCVDTRVLDASFAGREFDASLLADLPPGVDPCGENGEFHTCVYDGPMFAAPLAIDTGVAVTKPPFAWRDFTRRPRRATRRGRRMTPDPYPRRIVCLTEETTETLYLLGEGDRVAGVSGYTVRPPEARQKPRVSAFIHARYDKIEALEPDLDPRLLRPPGRHRRRARQARLSGDGLQPAQRRRDPADDPHRRRRWSAGRNGPRRSPPSSSAASTRCARRRRSCRAGRACSSRNGTRRSSRASAGSRSWSRLPAATPIFPELRDAKLAKDRIVDPDEVVRREPDVIVASWCGKAVRAERIRSRPGWDRVPAVRLGRIHEIKSPLILQPGPAALTDGLQQLHQAITAAVSPVA